MFINNHDLDLELYIMNNFNFYFLRISLNMIHCIKSNILLCEHFCENTEYCVKGTFRLVIYILPLYGQNPGSNMLTLEIHIGQISLQCTYGAA